MGARWDQLMREAERNGGIPVLPGPVLIWLGAFVWAWADNFTRIGWGTLIVLGVLALIAWGSDLFLTTVMSRRAASS